MPIVTFIDAMGRKLSDVMVESGTLLFDAAQMADLPVASSCKRQQTCGKCHMRVLSGQENLSMRVESEVLLLEKEKSPDTDRISCIAAVSGDCVVTTGYW